MVAGVAERCSGSDARAEKWCACEGCRARATWRLVLTIGRRGAALLPLCAAYAEAARRHDWGMNVEQVLPAHRGHGACKPTYALLVRCLSSLSEFCSATWANIKGAWCAKLGQEGDQLTCRRPRTFGFDYRAAHKSVCTCREVPRPDRARRG
jgi:hypothetical protein